MLNKHTRQKQQQQGFTLVELSITLVLISGIVLSGLYFVQRIQIENAINKTASDAAVSMNAAIAAVAGESSTEGHTLQSLSTMNVWARDRLTVNANGVVTNVAGPFPGSSESILPNTVEITKNLPKGQGFVYFIDSVPAEACSNVAKNLSLHPNVVQVKVGAKGSFMDKATDMASADGARIVDPGKLGAATGCGGTTTPKKVFVAFTKS
jgi:prepilin-type N-terminal cleavage/methylation domain-containing protein